MRWGGMHFDCGGLGFQSDISIDGNYLTILSILKPSCPSLYGNFFSSQQISVITTAGDVGRIWIPPNSTPSKIGTSVYDVENSVWVSASVEYTPHETFVAAHVSNLGSLRFVAARDGSIIDSNETSYGKISTRTSQSVFVGCWPDGSRPFFGDVWAVAIWVTALSDVDIEKISSNMYECTESCLPKSDKLVSCIIFDRLKYGDVPVDIVNGVKGVAVNSEKIPRWNLMLTSDVGLEVLG